MDIYLYSPILDGTAQEVVNQLKEAGNDTVNVHINSPGGSVFEGFAVYNLLKNRGNINIYIDGLAASIASVIAMAGNRIYMSESSQLMIHNSRTMAGGTKYEIEKQIELLDKIDGQLLEIYSARSGMDKETLKDFLENETWFDASEAQAAGFVDEILENLKIAAYYNNFNKMDWNEAKDKFKALGNNLGFFEDDEKVTEKAEELKEEVTAEVEEEVKEIQAGAEGAEILTSNMVPMATYLESMKYLENAFKVVLDYIEDQPTKEEITDEIKATANEYFTTLIKRVKTETEVPVPKNNFEEVLDPEVEEDKENLAYMNQRLEEHKAKLRN